MAEMTKDVIVASCKANGGYAAPLLNDQLYLHCKGYIHIANLEEYTNAKVLWLEQNAITELSGMEHQQQLVSLFLQNNMIRSLRTLMTPLRNLRVLNLSHNYLTSLAGLGAACPQLETLQVSHNRIASLEACEDLFALANTLTSVDLSFNAITAYDAATAAAAVAGCAETTADTVREEENSIMDDAAPVVRIEDDVRVVEIVGDEEAQTPSPSQGQQLALSREAPKDPLVIVNFFKCLPNVSVIYLHGNSISHGLKHYRRNMILHLPQLTYLDERPVFEDERRVVEAWGRGGSEAESAERAAIREAKKAHLNSCVQVLTDKMEANRALRDRLTQEWDARRAEEMEQLTQLRREHRDARAALESREGAARTGVEHSEQASRWDLEEAYADALGPLVAAESQHRHAYEQKQAVAAVTREVEEEIAGLEAAVAAEEGDKDTDATPITASEGACAEVASVVAHPGTARERSGLLAELMKSDEDVLREMEEEIDQVLGSLGPSSSLLYAGMAEPVARRASASLGSMAVKDPADGLAAAASGAAPVSSPHATRLTPASGAAAAVVTTSKTERGLHAAVESVSSKLRAGATPTAPAEKRVGAAIAEERAATHADVWARFGEWERRQRKGL